LKAEAEFGAESVWPYHYAGTMGLVQRDSIHRLRHAKGYSRQFDTICTNMAWTGYVAGTGRLAGPDPREMAVSDQIVIWGTNPVATQVNVMTHAVRPARRAARRSSSSMSTDETIKQADLGPVLKPGTDAALACAAMHVLFPRRPCRPGLSGALHRLSGGAGGAPRRRRRSGRGDHRS
jgi:anaerobic selenocysteine-containing dehydrogenase